MINSWPVSRVTGRPTTPDVNNKINFSPFLIARLRTKATMTDRRSSILRIIPIADYVRLGLRYGLRRSASGQRYRSEFLLGHRARSAARFPRVFQRVVSRRKRHLEGAFMQKKKRLKAARARRRQFYSPVTTLRRYDVRPSRDVTTARQRAAWKGCFKGEEARRGEKDKGGYKRKENTSSPRCFRVDITLEAER